MNKSDKVPAVTELYYVEILTASRIAGKQRLDFQVERTVVKN